MQDERVIASSTETSGVTLVRTNCPGVVTAIRSDSPEEVVEDAV
jgi:hypothetical protein